MSARRAKKGRGKTPGRQTVGFLTYEIADPFGAALWAGIARAAWELDVNLLCFVGGELRPPGFLAHPNAVYDLVDARNVDGLAISSTLGAWVAPNDMAAFCAGYHPLPVVICGWGPDGIPSIVADNYAGMQTLLTHLFEDHGHQRIAFIQGDPDDLRNPGAALRYRAYVDFLAERGLPLDPDLVTFGYNQHPWGVQAVQLLLDERKVEFDAIVANNDNMALGALEELQARGIDVPGDVSVAGFDDIPESASFSPSLTTVRYPIRETGARALEVLLGQLRGEQVPLETVLPTHLVVRQSCGCPPPSVARVTVEPVHLLSETTVDRPLRTTLVTRREEVLSTILTTVESFGAGTCTREQAEALVDAFVANMETDLSSDPGEPASAPGSSSPAAPGVFLVTLDRILQEIALKNRGVSSWQNVISILRRYVARFASRRELAWSENLFQQARVLVGDVALHAHAYRQLKREQQWEQLQETGRMLATSLSYQEMLDVLVRQLPQLGISGCYVCLYEDPTAPNGWTRCTMGYSGDRCLESGTGGQRLPAHQLVPDGALPTDERYSLVVQPLYQHKNLFGFVTLIPDLWEEPGEAMFSLSGLLYTPRPRTWTSSGSWTLNVQLSSALQVAHLVQQEARRAVQLRTAAEVSRSASSVLDPEQLIQEVVDLARERFDLYYAGLFLVDRSGEWTLEPGRWVVLRAGTGEAGRQLLAQNHKLEVGGDSMVGWCVANKRARIALDVGEEAVRFDNPLLPLTRSELALPLISRDEAIGALTIQSAHEAAFSDEDIAVLQAMADQLANAITNARLYSQAQKEIIERQQTEEALARQAKALDAELEQIFFVASHHLQEPLRQVVNNSQLLKQRYVDLLDAEGDEFIGYAVDGAMRIQTLVNDMLAFSRVGTRSRPFELVDCSITLDRVLTQMDSVLVAAGATVTRDDLPTVEADKVLLSKLFLNLVENALKFRSEDPPEIHVGVVQRKDEWLFSVHDNGIGIEPQYYDRIFRIFQRLHTSAQYPGTGIGLAICKKIVELHDGRIWVESELGQGSTFHFTIPMVKG